MSPKVVSVPLRIGLSATRTTLTLSAKLAVYVAGEVVHVAQSQFGSSPTQTSTRPAPAPARSAPARPAAPTPSNGASASAAPAPASPPAPLNGEVVSPIEAYPDTPLTREEADAKTIDDTDEVVAEFAEAGAEDGAGAQIAFDEPWEGYDSANVEAVTAHLASADAAELAVVELYEQTHKGRKTVLDAAAKRLKELTPPN